MNKFVAKRPTFFLVISWFFAAAFINDAANLTDIFPQTATLHFSEGDGSDALAQFNSTNISSSTCSDIVNRNCYRQPPKVGVKHVLLDEDSPSIPAVSLQTEYAFFFIPQEETHFYHSHNSNSPLYLQNCILLI
jgi:hypothetical protein